MVYGSVMALNVLRFCSLLFTALALAPALAHLLELPNKLRLDRDAYLIVQQIYRGWSLLGVVVILAFLANAAYSVALARSGRPFALPLAATLAILATQVVFWLFTYPANHATNNWTALPANWMSLRVRWEYSHAASAVLNLIALITLILALLLPRE